MINCQNVDLEIFQSWNRCIENSVNINISKPQISISNFELQKKLKKEEKLISIFEITANEILTIANNYSYGFLLFDKDKIVISKITSQKNSDQLKEHGIKPGVSFSEKSIGVNSVAVADKKGDKIMLDKQDHFCHFMRKISCCAVPLKISGSIIGFLCVNTGQNSEKENLKIIIDILSNAMINKLHLSECRKYKNRLSSQQLKILSLLANGKTESEIAKDLNYSVQTIKYHKRKIFDKFEVDNTRTAITKLYKYNDSKCSYK